MNPGTVLLARVQQSDGKLKIRPVIVFAVVPPYQDLLVCAVSSQTRHEVTGFDELLLDTSSDFVQSGLKTSSLDWFDSHHPSFRCRRHTRQCVI
jgi:mRNA interferase MazF